MLGICPGGRHFHIYAYWVYAARETPIFSPKFPLRSITILHFCRTRRPSVSKFLYIKAFHRQSASQTHPTVSSGDPTFTLELAPVPRIFTLESRSGAPHFCTLPRHIISWGECPDPPPPPRVCQRNVIVHAKSKLHVSRQ